MQHIEHVDADDISTIDKLIAFFKQTCNGNGRLLLHIFGGKVQDFEPTSKISNKKRTA